MGRDRIRLASYRPAKSDNYLDRLLAQDFDVAADAFGYDALEALRERYLNAPVKSKSHAGK